MGSRSSVHPGSGADRWFALKSQVHQKLVNSLTPEQLKNLNKDSVRGQVGTVVEKLVIDENLPMTMGERERLTEEILDEVFGLGPLEPLLKDPTISDIMVNGFDNVYVERAGRLVETNIRFKDHAHVRIIIERIVSSIRRYGKKVLPTEDLLKNDTFTTGMLDFMSGCVEARLNIVISGGSGSGKTTLLNTLSRFIPEEERIITIEDTAELQLQQGHVVRLETRPMNIEGAGAITPRDLVINTLRMRPDRIIVGESRGAEALDMLQAMNTGHDGSMTTVHANGPRDAFSRLETMVMMASQHVPDRVIRQQLASAIHIVAHCARLSDGTRKLTGVAEVIGVENDLVEMQDIFEFERSGLSPRGKVLGRFRATGARPICLDRLKSYGIHLSNSIFHEEHEVK